MIWMDIPGWKGYKASLDGQIMSVKDGEPKIITQRIDPSTGRLRVDLYQDGFCKRIPVHRLIALAFLGEPEPGMHVCHNDGNPLNNRLGNLRYDTPKANAQDSITHGTHVSIAIAARTHCNRGHEFTPDNIYWRKGRNGKTYRQCKRCQIDATMRWRATEKGQKRFRESQARWRAKRKASSETAPDVCVHGHELTPDNIYWRPGRNGKTYRKCKKCQIAATLKCRAKKKAATPTGDRGEGG